MRIRVAGLLVRDGKFLCVTHRKGRTNSALLPGGGADSNENLVQSLMREFQEELGMTVDVGRVLMLAQSIAPDQKRNIVHIVFRVFSLEEPRFTGVDPRVSGYFWYDPKNREEIPFYPSVLEQVIDLCQSSQYDEEGIALELPLWVE